jgi:hypothetical protein
VAPSLLLKEAPIIFVGSVIDTKDPDGNSMAAQGGYTGYVFSIQESFAGTSGGETVIYSLRNGGFCGYQFKEGEQYLVYAYSGWDKLLYSSICSRTQSIAEAEILIRQLRAAREGKPFASLFGSLWRRQPYSGIFIDDYDRPIRNARISVREKSGKTFTAKTGDSGEYSFYDLPAGVYEVSTDLPAGLRFDSLLPDPPTALSLSGGTSLRHDIHAMPRSKIQGHLLGRDGKFIQGTVELFREDRYPIGGSWKQYSGERGFAFNNVTPGNYILVFNDANRVTAESPYSRVFFPGVTDLAQVDRISVSERDQDIEANIDLGQGIATVDVLIRVRWANTNGKESPVFVRVHSTPDDVPFAMPLKGGLFSVRLLKDVTYTIRAIGYCQTDELAETETLTAKRITDSSIPLLLTFPSDACP